MNLDALVAPLRANVVSGASVVARTAAEVVRRAAVGAPATDVADLRATLADLAGKILDAQPAMAPLVSLAAAVLGAIEDSPDLHSGRRDAARAAEAFRSSLEELTRAVARLAATRLPREGTVLTLSSSSTVCEAIVERGGGSALRVICLESRPMNEGRRLAESLARQGIPVLLAVDAATLSVLPSADVVLMGADSIGDRGVVNKIGSRGLAGAAQRLGIPVLVTADQTKLLPPGFPQPVEDERPGEEVWRAPPGVRVWNRYFETLSLDDVSFVVTDTGILSPGEVAEQRERIAVPQELRDWAAQRAGAGG